MTLSNLTIQACIWLLRLLKSFLRVKSLLTTSVIIISTLSKISHILAFLLPLKVILLFGSNRIPKYFKSFIEPDEKMEWAIGLALATVFFYLLSQMLDYINEILINKGAFATVQSANKLTVLHRQQEFSEKYFKKVTNIFSLILFLLVNTLVLIWLNPKVLSILFFGLFLGFLLASILVEIGQINRKNNNSQQLLLSPSWIENNWKSYNTTLFSLLFLLGFFSIIYPYFLGQGPNILISLISFIMIRHISKRGKSLTNGLIKIFRNRHRINALMLKQHQIEKRPSKTNNENFILNIFKERLRFLSQLLTLSEEESKSLRTHWVDLSTSNIQVFDGYFTKENIRYDFQWHLFTSQNLMHFEREQFLFNYISREKLFSVEPMAISTNSGLAYQLLNCGHGDKVPTEKWDSFYSTWMEKISTIKPPKKLVNAYVQTRPLLHHKLNADLLERLEKTLCTEHDTLALEHINNNLEQILEKIANIPLYLFNPSFRDEYTFVSPNPSSKLILTSWRAWSLMPLGSHFTLKELSNFNLLEDFLSTLKERRKDVVKSNIKVYDLKLSAYCTRLVKSLNDQKFTNALAIVKEINALH